MATGLSYDTIFLQHQTGPGHPERPDRLTRTQDYIATQAWARDLIPVVAQTATVEQLEAVHTLDYIRRAKAACEDGLPFLDSMDVAISAQSFNAAKTAAGTPIAIADEVVGGRLDNGFALVRPPGHHAEEATALGFCLFNNIAVAARHLQHRHGIDKVAIIDWDVHHGNGTQHAFDDDPSILFVSTHQYPYYPGTGAASETGTGRGAGSVVNCPMTAGATDADYEEAFSTRILPALHQFRPEFILISAGFDAHKDDPLAQINLSTDAFRWMTLRILEIADQYAGGRIVSMLEGGYNLDRLGPCVAAHLNELQGA